MVKVPKKTSKLRQTSYYQIFSKVWSFVSGNCSCSSQLSSKFRLIKARIHENTFHVRDGKYVNFCQNVKRLNYRSESWSEHDSLRGKSFCRTSIRRTIRLTAPSIRWKITRRWQKIKRLQYLAWIRNSSGFEKKTISWCHWQFFAVRVGKSKNLCYFTIGSNHRCES